MATTIQNLDKFTNDLDIALFLVDIDEPIDNLFYPHEMIKHYGKLIPANLLLTYLKKIGSLHSVTKRNIGELELSAIPKYKGNGELDDPNEFADSDLVELNYLYQFLGYLATLESIFTQELFDRA